MLRILAPLLLLAFLVAPLPANGAGTPLALPPGTPAILEHIYSGQLGLAIPEARKMQEQFPEHPLGYLLEAETIWWKIWCASAEFKFGMTMARRREKTEADQHYFDLTAKATSLAEAGLKKHDSAEMQLYAGMADALSSRLYGLRWESRNAARAGVRAREHFVRALALDASLADADMGLGLYNYYVDTLSTMARVLRFMMGIPGGSKAEGIALLQRAIQEGQLTPPLARFYLALNLHNYDQRYEEALQVILPLTEQYPQNPIFQLMKGDLYAKLGRKAQAVGSYQAAAAAKISDPDCQRKIDALVRQSLAAAGVTPETLNPK
jgi:tetratricopeptide (TPR) repeat protein